MDFLNNLIKNNTAKILQNIVFLSAFLCIVSTPLRTDDEVS